MGLGFSPTWLRQVSPLLHITQCIMTRLSIAGAVTDNYRINARRVQLADIPLPYFIPFAIGKLLVTSAEDGRPS